MSGGGLKCRASEHRMVADERAIKKKAATTAAARTIYSLADHQRRDSPWDRTLAPQTSEPP